MAISAALDIDEGGRLAHDGPALRFALRTAARVGEMDLGGGKPVDDSVIADVRAARQTMHDIDREMPLRPSQQGMDAGGLWPSLACDAVMQFAGLPPAFLMASNIKTVIDGATSEQNYNSFADTLDPRGDEHNRPPPPWVQAFDRLEATWGRLGQLDETGFDPRSPAVQESAQQLIANGRTGLIASAQQPSVRLPMPGLNLAA